MSKLHIYVLIDKHGHYYMECPEGKAWTTRHIQKAKWFIHDKFTLDGFTTTEVEINIKV